MSGGGAGLGRGSRASCVSPGPARSPGEHPSCPASPGACGLLGGRPGLRGRPQGLGGSGGGGTGRGSLLPLGQSRGWGPSSEGGRFGGLSAAAVRCVGWAGLGSLVVEPLALVVWSARMAVLASGPALLVDGQAGCTVMGCTRGCFSLKRTWLYAPGPLSGIYK